MGITRDFIQIGWEALHDAAAFYSEVSSVEVNEYKEFQGHDWLWRDNYCGLLMPIIEITKKDFNDDLLKSDLIKQSIWDYLAVLKIHSNKTSSAWKGISKSNLRKAYIDWAKNFTALKNTNFGPLDIVAALRLGWSLIEQSVQLSKGCDHLLWGLAIIGWVKEIYSQPTICPLCFRWAVAGCKYCYIHSQSKYAATSESIKAAYVEYRRGLKTLEIARKENLIIRPENNRLEEKFRIESLIGESIFFPNRAEEDVKEITDVLHISPNVLKRLDKSIEKVRASENQILFDGVRQVVNPNEYSCVQLATNIIHWENIILIEEHHLIRKGRPKDVVTKELIEKCIKLARTGTPKSQIAKELKISKSRLSNWIKRNSELARAFGNTI